MLWIVDVGYSVMNSSTHNHNRASRRRSFDRRTSFYRQLKEGGELSDDLCRLVAEVMTFVGDTGDEWLSHRDRR